jgi:hypothetical protein
MKSAAFAASLVAVANASSGYGYPSRSSGYGHGGYSAPHSSYGQQSYAPQTYTVEHKEPVRQQQSYQTPAYGQAASAQQEAKIMNSSSSDWDAWGRDQDYMEDISYDKTDAKSYAAESYDEWDNKDDDRYGANSYGQNRD